MLTKDFRHAIVAALIAMALPIALSACSLASEASGPSFICVITGGANWQPQIRITGPTPQSGLLNVNIVYYDAGGHEVGSDNYIPLGFSGVSVPSGQSMSYVLDSGYDPGLANPPASCQVAGYM